MFLFVLHCFPTLPRCYGKTLESRLNTIQYKHEYYNNDINPVEFREAQKLSKIFKFFRKVFIIIQKHKDRVHAVTEVCEQGTTPRILSVRLSISKVDKLQDKPSCRLDV